MNNGRFYYTIGNKKLGKDTLIFNMGSASFCPSDQLGLCPLGPINGNKRCYAFKAERQYKEVLPFRNKQKDYWQNAPISEKLIDLYSVLSKHKKIKFIRINESGDFWFQSCVKQLEVLANGIRQAFPHIKIYGYTKRQDLDFSNLPKNVIINGSGFTVHNNFDVDPYLKKKDKLKLARKQWVCIDDCTKCSLCKVRHGRTITQSIH